MNLLLLDAHELDPSGRAVLLDRRAEHAIRVLKAAPGDRLRAGILGAGQGTALVLDAGDGRLQVEVRADPSPAPEPEVDLVVGLPRPQVLHRVVQFSASMGVGSLFLVNAWRVEKSYFQSPAASPDKLLHHARLGAEQGMTTWLPRIFLEPLLVPFVRRLQTFAPDRRLLAHPDAGRPIEQVVADFENARDCAVTDTAGDDAARAGPEGGTAMGPEGGAGGAQPRWILAIGPEGGWIDREVETLTGAGFRSFDLGPRILRVEAALVAALAQLRLARRMLCSQVSKS
ncbi:MAG: 16S rRNA (uracil(1498)-N(3))-methyltransferase [Holophagales bacterium]|nr:16S rRNA (uracil(1498)-N(3))-methyltransferase [Holophagales bacterium]